VEPALTPETVRAAHEPGRAVITRLPSDAPPAQFGPHEPGTGEPPAPPIVIDDAGAPTGSTGDAETDRVLAEVAADVLERGRSRTIEAGGRQWFVEAFPRRPRLVVVGAVQVAIPLVAMARQLGYETVVIDGREAFATPERFPDVDQLIVGWPDEVADRIGLGPHDAVAVLTHDVKFDEPAIVTALARGCRYVGAVGSRKTQADRREQLRALGVPDEQLARLRGPIGLDLGGREPAETALAILAEVVAARFGGSGVPMRERAAAGAGRAA
jgi:xanthine dehydrogenase accessory factor